MKLVYYELNLRAVFDRGVMGAIILEHPYIFERFLISLHKQMRKEQTAFSIFEKEKELDLLKSCDFVISPFDLTFNKKEVTRRLFSELENIVGEQETVLRIYELFGETLKVLEQMKFTTEYNLGYSTDFSVQDIFKNFGVHIEEPTGSFVEKLIEYVIVMNRLLKKDLFILANCRYYLAEEDYGHIEKIAEHYNLCIIFVENTQLGLRKVKKEYIIDADLCEIH